MSSQPTDHSAWRLSSDNNKHLHPNVSPFVSHSHHLSLAAAHPFSPPITQRPSHLSFSHAQQHHQHHQQQPSPSAHSQQPQQNQQDPQQQQQSQQQHSQQQQQQQPQSQSPTQQQQQSSAQQQQNQTHQPQSQNNAQHDTDPSPQPSQQQLSHSHHSHPMNQPHSTPVHHQPASPHPHATQPPQETHQQPQPSPLASHSQSPLPHALPPPHQSHMLSAPETPTPADTLHHAQPPTPTGTPQGSRKKQFRFTVNSDVALLRLVLQYNPYAAPHGGRLHKWHAVANTLRASGIDIDFRRARDRTTLLLDQWRSRDLHSIRRCHSGNQQEQALKEKLLADLSNLEQAAKPRDNLSQWRAREATAVNVGGPRLGANPSSHSSPEGGPGAPTTAIMPDATSDPTQTVGAGGPGSTDHSIKFPSLQTGPAHLRNLVPPDSHVLSPTREGGDLQLALGGAVVAAAAAQCQPPAEKMLKNNQGQRSNAHFSQSLFEAHGAASATDRRSTGRASDMSAYRSDHLSLSRVNQAANVFKNSAAAAMASASLDTGAGVQLVGSPGGALRSTPGQLEGGGNAAALAATALDKAGVDAAEIVQLRLKVSQLENRLEEEIRCRKQAEEIAERRWQFERERETQRLQLEKERIEKEFEDRKEEREDRRRRELRDKEERDRMLQIISRHRLDANLSDADNPE